MSRWEYKDVKYEVRDELLKQLNALGQEGWEYVETAFTPTKTSYGLVFMRRRIEIPGSIL